jgi:hypothetical protein
LKIFYQIIAAVSLAAFLFSCKQKKPGKNQEQVILSPLIKKEIEVTLLGEVRTRRSFANIQFMDDDKEIDRYVAQQEKSNPEIINSFSAADSFLITQFERIGLVKNDEFLPRRFKPQTKDSIKFVDNAQRVFDVIFHNDSLSGSMHIKISSSKSSVEIDTKAMPTQNLDYAFMDIIPGGNKELVFLDDYYFMGGYNFDFKVYEIKTR